MSAQHSGSLALASQAKGARHKKADMIFPKTVRDLHSPVWMAKAKREDATKKCLSVESSECEALLYRNVISPDALPVRGEQGGGNFRIHDLFIILIHQRKEELPPGIGLRRRPLSDGVF